MLGISNNDLYIGMSIDSTTTSKLDKIQTMQGKTTTHQCTKSPILCYFVLKCLEHDGIQEIVNEVYKRWKHGVVVWAPMMWRESNGPRILEYISKENFTCILFVFVKKRIYWEDIIDLIPFRCIESLYMCAITLVSIW